MIWPFPKADDAQSVVTSEIYEHLFGFLADESAQIAQYPDSLKSEMMNGYDCDEIPGSAGNFGTSLTNPIPVNGPIGQMLYLSSLRHGDERLLFHRLTSVDRIDVFESVGIEGYNWELLYLDMYHPRKSKRAPEGYTIADDNVLLSGLTCNVPDFPRTLYSGIVSYSETRFGMSIADPLVRIFVERKNYVRPALHVEKLRQVMGHPPVPPESDFFQQIASETIDTQKHLYDVLVKFNVQNVRFEEIVFFSLTTSIHALFNWHNRNATKLADELSETILRVNINGGGLDMTMSEAVRAFRPRFAFYQQLLELRNDPLSFGSQLSRAFVGRNDAVVGISLAATSNIILKSIKDLITDENARA